MFKLSNNQGLQMMLMGYTWQLFGSARQGQQERREPGAKLDGGEGLEPVTMARAGACVPPIFPRDKPLGES